MNRPTFRIMPSATRGKYSTAYVRLNGIRFPFDAQDHLIHFEGIGNGIIGSGGIGFAGRAQVEAGVDPAIDLDPAAVISEA